MVRAELVDAEAAVASDDWGRALACLLAVWRAAPAEAVGDAIEAVSARALDRFVRPIAADKGVREQRWDALADAGDPVAMGWLCATVAATRRSAHRIRRLIAMASHGRDPRVADIVCRLLESAALTRSDAIWQVLELQPSPRALARVRKFSTIWPDAERVVSIGRLEHALAVLEAAPVPVLGDEDVAVCARIVAASPSSPQREIERAALLAAIYAAPHEDGPRLIYADWLQQHGDPRGEFIALQLASSKSARVTALAQTFDAEWRTPLPLVAVDIEYQRGFVAAAANTGWIDDNPAWATIEICDGVPFDDRARVASLRELRHLRDKEVEHLARLTAALPVERLTWSASRTEGSLEAEPAITAFTKISVLPALRHLALERFTFPTPHAGISLREIARLATAPCMAELETLRLRFQLALFDRLIAVLAPNRIARVELDLGAEARLAITDRCTALEVRIQWWFEHPYWTQLLTAIERLPAGQLASVRVIDANQPDRQLARWQHALRMQRAELEVS